jgi:protein-S-isoprenylcysteine O-methyltransferase Ste14
MEILNIFGAAAFAFLYMLRLHEAANGGGMVSVLLASQAGMAAFLLVFHRPAGKTSPWHQHLQAWTCAFMPFLLQGGETRAAIWMIVPGLVLSVWSLVVLGRSFSISPDDRGLVEKGPYRFVRHPMYAGEMLSFLGLCLAYPSPRNLWITGMIAAMILARINAEESVLSEYEPYKKSVRWRMIPYVW